MDNRRAPLFAGLAVAAVAILMVLLLVLPKMSQVSTAQDQLDQAQRDQQTLESRKSALEDAKAAAPQARKTIAEVNQRIPATAEEPGLILLLQNAAISAGIDRVARTPARNPPPQPMSRARSPAPAILRRSERTSRKYANRPGVRLPCKVLSGLFLVPPARTFAVVDLVIDRHRHRLLDLLRSR